MVRPTEAQVANRINNVGPQAYKQNMDHKKGKTELIIGEMPSTQYSHSYKS